VEVVVVVECGEGQNKKKSEQRVKFNDTVEIINIEKRSVSY
jgi:hypothetical protein